MKGQSMPTKSSRIAGWLMIAVGIGGACAAAASLTHPDAVAVAVILKDSAANVSMLVSLAIAVSLVICAAQCIFGVMALRNRPTRFAMNACLCMGIFLACDGALDIAYGQVVDGTIKLVQAASLVCYFAFQRKLGLRGA